MFCSGCFHPFFEIIMFYTKCSSIFDPEYLFNNLEQINEEILCGFLEKRRCRNVQQASLTGLHSLKSQCYKDNDLWIYKIQLIFCEIYVFYKILKILSTFDTCCHIYFFIFADLSSLSTDIRLNLLSSHIWASFMHVSLNALQQCKGICVLFYYNIWVWMSWARVKTPRRK